MAFSSNAHTDSLIVTSIQSYSSLRRLLKNLATAFGQIRSAPGTHASNRKKRLVKCYELSLCGSAKNFVMAELYEPSVFRQYHRIFLSLGIIT